MLLYGHDASVNYQWQYAACDSACTSGANWTVITLVQPAYSDVNTYDYPLHNFALDGLGRPRFIYTIRAAAMSAPSTSIATVPAQTATTGSSSSSAAI